MSYCEHCPIELALTQLRQAFADIHPICTSGFAMDFAHTKSHQANALVIFGWLLRDKEKLDAIIQDYEINKAEISKRIGLIFPNQPPCEAGNA